MAVVDDTGTDGKCGWSESLSDHACVGGQTTGCYDFRQGRFFASVELGSVKPFLNEKNVSRTCSESFSHPYPGQGPIHHSFNGYVTTTLRYVYFPAPELISKDKQIRAEVKNKTKPNVPASVKPPGSYSSNPPQSSAYTCS